MATCNASDIINDALSSYNCSSALLLPLVNEYTWPRAARIIVYLVGLLWSFFGVSIIADIFMCSIEKITSKHKTIVVADPNSTKGNTMEIEIKVWNDTVANLTLMALGSSAPEILLSIIEVAGRTFVAGELGPSTIVGSAAFNLLVITAICIVSIPSTEQRRIKAIKVFAVTSVFSIFAYIWMLIVLRFNTRNYVDLWEACATFAFFPILVVIAYIVDKEFCCKRPDESDDIEMRSSLANGLRVASSPVRLAGHPDGAGIPVQAGDGRVDPESMKKFLKEIGRNPNLTEEDASKIAAALIAENSSHSRMWYRIHATRSIAGGAKLVPVLNEFLKEYHDRVVEPELGSAASMKSEASLAFDQSLGGTLAVVQFTASSVSVLENAGHVRLFIERGGLETSKVMVKVETIDGTANAGSDYVARKETIVFEPGETQKTFDVEIINDVQWEPDEVFFVRLTLEGDLKAVIGKKSICQVTIIDDDEPGMIEFANPSFLFKESAGKANLTLRRFNGADGIVSVNWKTEDMTAISGQDYTGGEGTIEFQHGETQKTLEIPLNDDQSDERKEAEKDEHFRVILSDPEGGAKLGRMDKTVVTIVNDDEYVGMVNRLVNMTNLNIDALRVDRMTWSEQFRNALNVNGGDVDNATALDYVMHFITFGWKVLFAFVPPPSIAGGWLAFIISLLMIGVLTAFVGDLATIFGCLIGLRDPVTAITFVALGTSLPDLFASRQAAVQEKYADNAIGNVTGSNSVNVFLGLGITWIMSCIYWSSQPSPTPFQVPADDLTYSVTIYTIVSLVCIALILARRYMAVFGKTELGGKNLPRILSACFLLLLWFLYVLLSAFQVYGYIPSF